MKTQIDPEHVHGEKGTGYLDEERECASCEYFVPKNSGCSGKAMKAKSRLPKNSDGTVKVSPAGSCIYFDWRKSSGPYKRAAEK